MFVEENTRMLDPTCGSGTALRAAEYHDAAQILGIEINEHARRMKRDNDGLITKDSTRHTAESDHQQSPLDDLMDWSVNDMALPFCGRDMVRSLSRWTLHYRRRQHLLGRRERL
jgi:hypothetical protein